MYILQAAALQKKQKLQDSLDFGTGAAPQREGRQAATEATEDQQQEEELKAAAANNNTNNGCCEEATDCELFPLHKPAASAGSQESAFGSLLCKRNHSERIEELPIGQDEQILFGNVQTEILIANQQQHKLETKSSRNTAGKFVGSTQFGRCSFKKKGMNDTGKQKW